MHFVPPKRGSVAARCWSQHAAAWKDAEAQDAKWIRFITDERCAMQLADASTKGAVQNCSTALVGALRRELSACLSKARSHAPGKTPRSGREKKPIRCK